MNLIPENPGELPGYWCTWGAQNYSIQEMDDTSWDKAFNNLDEHKLLVDPGWLVSAFEPVRSDLYVLFDVGWDTPANVPIEHERWRLGSMVPDTARFPSCTGEPADRLAALKRLVQEAGWRGVGLWVALQLVNEGVDGIPPTWAETEAYWRERARWSGSAGIDYWKVDVGLHAHELEYRKMLTNIAREEAPGLILEHAVPLGPLNDEALPWSDFRAESSGRYALWNDGKILSDALELLAFSDVLRTYDVTNQLSVATTLDRVAQLLNFAPQTQGMGLLNCENELYLGAALGCALGVMRHPAWGDFPDRNYDPYLWRQRSDEVVRAVRWQRIAPAFGANAAPVLLSDTTLTDRWYFQAGETWATFYYNQEFSQSAPAVTARGMPLPDVSVTGTGEAPYVVASRFPGGAVAVASLPRTDPKRGIYLPLADVSIEWDGSQPLGVFGRFQSLRLCMNQPLGSKRVWAQDLAGEYAQEITSQVHSSKEEINLPGELIERVGVEAASSGDISEPGLVVVIQ
jgi:hypothetical protein